MAMCVVGCVPMWVGGCPQGGPVQNPSAPQAAELSGTPEARRAEGAMPPPREAVRNMRANM
jgi:hypothetical protein